MQFFVFRFILLFPILLILTSKTFIKKLSFDQIRMNSSWFGCFLGQFAKCFLIRFSVDIDG